MVPLLTTDVTNPELAPVLVALLVLVPAVLDPAVLEFAVLVPAVLVPAVLVLATLPVAVAVPDPLCLREQAAARF